METMDFIRSLAARGVICGEYKKKINYISTKKDLFKILCDANGASFIAELKSMGLSLPLESFKKEYSQYINGKKVMEYPDGVTSKMFIDYNDEIIADTTILSLVNCKSNIIIPKNHFPRIILDKDCTASIVLGQNSRLALDVFDGATFNITGDQTRVRISYYPKKNNG